MCRPIRSIFLFCLDKGFQSYFLLEICFVTLVHHNQNFQKIPSMFHCELSKRLDKNCTRQSPETICKVLSKSKNREQSYSSINEKLLKHAFSLLHNQWHQNFHTWYLTYSRTHGISTVQMINLIQSVKKWKNLPNGVTITSFEVFN